MPKSPDNDSQQSSSPTGSLLIVLTVILAVVLGSAVTPVSSQLGHNRQQWVAGLAILLLLVYMAKARTWGSLAFAREANKVSGESRFGPKWFFALALAATCVWGGLSYLRFEPAKLATFGGYKSAPYYYLNTKYFQELGYDGLYRATLVADAELPRKDQALSLITDYRDLDSYTLVPRSAALQQRAQIKRRFKLGRWEEFKSDTRYILERGADHQKSIMLGYGFQRPPSWTLFIGALANKVPVESLSLLAAIDIGGMLLLFLFLARTFGNASAGFAFLLFVTTASGDQALLGNTIGTYTWLVAVGLGVCALRKQRFQLAGGLLAFGACLHALPVFFLASYLVWAIADVSRNGRYGFRRQSSFGFGVVSVGLLVMGTTIAAFGWESIGNTIYNFSVHQSPDALAYGTRRIGGMHAFIYGGERTWAEFVDSGSWNAKRVLLTQYAPFAWACAAAAGLAVIFRFRCATRNPWDAVLAGSLPLFVALSFSIDDLNIRLLLVAAHCVGIEKGRNQAGVLALFAIELVCQWAMANGFSRFAITGITSAGLVAYWLQQVVLWALEKKTKNASVSSSAGAVGFIALFIVLGHLSNSTPVKTKAGAVIVRSMSDVSKLYDSGSPSDTPELVHIPKGGRLSISIGETSHATSIDLSFDNDDTYTIAFHNGSKAVSRVTIALTKKKAQRGKPQLQRETINVPKAAVSTGYTKIVISPSKGDGEYAIGHAVLK